MIFINDFGYVADTLLCRTLYKLGLCRSERCTATAIVHRYVVRRFRRLAMSFGEKSTNVKKTPYTNNTIWVFWAQGRNSMPTTVNACISQIDRMRGDYNLIVLDADSYKDYVDIPEIILRKLDEGKMSLTHFSDILRFALLYKYGGWWMDATIYPVKPIEQRKLLYTVKLIYMPKYISGAQWSSFLWYMPAGHPMACFLSAAWKEYWEKNDKLVEYFLIDHLIKLFYDTNDAFRHEIDALPMENEYLYFMQSEDSNLPFEADKWKEVCENTKFFKCNWRNELNKETFRWQVFM